MNSRRLVAVGTLAAMLLAGSVRSNFAQTILREVFTNITGSAVGNLTSAPTFPHAPDLRVATNLFEAPVNWADNYGTRMRGYVVPPETGPYVFWIASDDQSELYVSRSDHPTDKTLVAWVNAYTSARQWTKETSQQSPPISLLAGQRYYLEVLQKEGTGGDHLAVGWQLPSGTLERPIPGARLQPWLLLTNAPLITTEPLDATVFEGQTARFTVYANGAEPLQYQWYRDGNPLEAEIGASLWLPDVQVPDSGAQFECGIANALGQITSRRATLTVLPETNGPAVIELNPPAGGTMRSLTQVEVLFNEAVTGVDAGDLLVNGVPAVRVAGLLAGPYVFEFTSQPAGGVTLAWQTNHGIVDLSLNANPLAGADWSYVVDPASSPGQLAITEFMAANETGLRDEDGECGDWIEIQNRGDVDIDLLGWALSDDADQPGKWTFPPRVLRAGEFLVVFASGKDRRPAGTNNLHTNFKLGSAGESLALYAPESPRPMVSGFVPQYPEQRTDYSFGRDTQGAPVYFQTSTPGLSNSPSVLTGLVSEVRFSAPHGVFNRAFNLYLSSATPGAAIRYTTDGSVPGLASGYAYTGSVRIASTTLLRAAAFQNGCLPSLTATHTYLMGLNATQMVLPVISIVTDTNHLFGPAGILGISGGYYSNNIWLPLTTNDYHNPSETGLAWERPASAELILPFAGDGFQIDCGLRVQGSPYMRPRYRTTSKYSFRLYFRGDYGPGRLDYPFFPNAPVSSFDVISLRGGHNDAVNPFIKDELVRRLILDMGQAQLHGTFMNLFLNGVYKGYYNPCERVDDGFLQSYHGGGEAWDVITVGSVVQDGDSAAWNALRAFVSGNHQAVPGNYLKTCSLLEVTNFVDYLLVNAWCATRDWPQNNWRAARERSPRGQFRFYVWDAEGAFGTFGQPVNYDVFNATTNISGEVLATGTREIARLYQGLVQSPEWRMLFADRVHKHLFNGGALVEARVTGQFQALQREVVGVIPSMNQTILTSWIPNRRSPLVQHLAAQGLYASEAAPVFSQHGGRVPAGFNLTIAAPVPLYFTTDGSDPRTAFSGALAPGAQLYINGQPLTIGLSMVVKARSLDGTNWSALTEAQFTVNQLALPVHITELMYHPPGGDAYEFVELHNRGAVPIDLGGFSFEGMQYQFPTPTVLAAGAVLVLSSALDPAAFSIRYPGVALFGTFGGSLANGGERLALRDRDGHIVCSVDYDDGGGWSKAADGEGASLCLVDLHGDPDAPTNWRASGNAGGSPGVVDRFPPLAPAIRLNEVMAENLTTISQGTNYPDWVELFNASDTDADLAGWSLSDDSDPRKFVFPTGAALPAGGHLMIWCDRDTNAPGWHTGFALDRDGESLFLFDAQTNLVDAVTFGVQLADYSVGRLETDKLAWQLNQPTPGGSNLAAEVTALTNLVLNEWLANPVAGEDDWIELYNSDTNLPAAWGGCFLASSSNVSRLRELSFVAPGGFLLFWADENPGRYQLDFKLPAAGSVITLYDETGAVANQVTNPSQLEGVSRGRQPDGAATVVSFVGRATPGAPNTLPGNTGLTLNKVLAKNVSAITNADGRVVDWLELYNARTTNVDLTGFSLSLGTRPSPPWHFPPGVVLETKGYLAIACDGERPASTSVEPTLNTGRNLPDDSGGVWLSDADGRLVDAVEYGFQVADLPLGRFASTWLLLSAARLGTPNTNLASLGPVSSLRLNEWMANTPGGEDWFELYNTGDRPVPLAGLCLTDDPSLAGQNKFLIGKFSFLGPRSWAVLVADAQPNAGLNHANFSLNENGEYLYLGQTNGALIHAVDFGPQLPRVSQGSVPDGSTNLFSFPTTPSPGAMNLLDGDGDGMPDLWESSHALNAADAADALADADGDGVSNRDEYACGSNPRDAQDYLKVDVSLENRMATIAFTAVAGRSYTLLQADAISPPSWTKLRDYEASATTRRVVFVEANAVSAARYYRVVTPQM